LIARRVTALKPLWKRAIFRLWPWAADEFTVYKKGGRSGHATISDRKHYLLQLLIDLYFGRQFTVMRRPLSTAIDRGALSLSKECLRADTPRSFAKKSGAFRSA
jgi:hypothetical protein